MSTPNEHTLQEWIVEALTELGGSATLLDICKVVWRRHAADLERSGDLFYSRQYDIRWTATALREQKLLRDATLSPRGTWELNQNQA